MHRERASELVDSREVGLGDREWLADEAAEEMMTVANGDDEVADAGAVVAQLRLFAQWRRRRGWHHFAASEVLHDQAEVVLRQTRRDLIAVGCVGSHRDPGARREVLHGGPRHIVVDDVGEPHGGCFSSQLGITSPGASRDSVIISMAPVTSLYTEGVVYAISRTALAKFYFSALISWSRSKQQHARRSGPLSRGQFPGNCRPAGTRPRPGTEERGARGGGGAAA